MTDMSAGKVCIVTGVASGIGFAVSEALLNRGAVVCLADRSEDGLAAVKEQLKTYPNARFAIVDVTKQEEVAGLIRSCAAENGRLDYLSTTPGLVRSFPLRR